MNDDIKAIKLIIEHLTMELEKRQAESLNDFPVDAACGVQTEGEPSEWLELATEIAFSQAMYLSSNNKLH